VTAAALVLIIAQRLNSGALVSTPYAAPRPEPLRLGPAKAPTPPIMRGAWREIGAYAELGRGRSDDPGWDDDVGVAPTLHRAVAAAETSPHAPADGPTRVEPTEEHAPLPELALLELPPDPQTRGPSEMAAAEAGRAPEAMPASPEPGSPAGMPAATAGADASAAASAPLAAGNRVSAAAADPASAPPLAPTADASQGVPEPAAPAAPPTAEDPQPELAALPAQDVMAAPVPAPGSLTPAPPLPRRSSAAEDAPREPSPAAAGAAANTPLPRRRPQLQGPTTVNETVPLPLRKPKWIIEAARQAAEQENAEREAAEKARQLARSAKAAPRPAPVAVSAPVRQSAEPQPAPASTGRPFRGIDLNSP
jgi:hypothetical protein